MRVGNVEKYRTGEGWRYRVRWSLPDASRRSKSFRLRKDADAWLRKVEADRLQGIVNDPQRSRQTFQDYAPRWIADRTSLAPRTVELYESQLRRWLLPTFGRAALGSITVEQVRHWRAEVARRRSEVTAAKCYRLLRVILQTAEADGLIPRNPCRVAGAAVERSPERPLLSVEQVVDLAEAIAPRYRALVLLAAFGGLRRGELLGLRRRHVDIAQHTVRVEGQAQRLKGHGRVIRRTKSDAGHRTIALNSVVMAELVDHMSRLTGSDPDAWLFVETNGSAVSENGLYLAWRAACVATGLVEHPVDGERTQSDGAGARPAVRFHDLRHFAGTQAARKGYTGRELQARLGHGTARASMLYQHAADERDRELAERVGEELTGLLTSRASAATSSSESGKRPSRQEAAEVTPLAQRASGSKRRTHPEPIEVLEVRRTLSGSAHELDFRVERMTGVEPA